MGKFDHILLTVDFDRTLTAPDSTIPQRNLEAIRYFMENGGAFTVNTGRSSAMFRRYMAQIPVNAPFLLYNGSGAYDYRTGEMTLLRPIDLPMQETLDTAVSAFPDLNVELQGIDAHYCFQSAGDWHGFYVAQGCKHLDAAPGLDYGPFLKFSLFGTLRKPTVADLFEGNAEEVARIDEAEAWLRAQYGDKVEVFRASPRIIDIHTKGVSKIKAARDLQKTLGRSVLVCVGDAENDISMLEGADYAYCPADGMVADRFETVCECANGAVADVIYKKIPEIPPVRP